MDEKPHNCLRCGRKLITSKSIADGYGPICFRKHKREMIGQKQFQLFLEDASKEGVSD